MSPSACSYHLRALAKYGFVEEVPSVGLDRRHRPWRARVIAMSVGQDPDRPANFVIAGAFDVALPALAHARFGAPGDGALIACFGAGSLAGTLTAARLGLRRPALGACASFLIGGVAISFVPFLGGLPGAAAAALVFGATGSFGNVIILTLLQRWAPAPRWRYPA